MNRKLLLLGVLLPGIALALDSIDESALSDETGAVPALNFKPVATLRPPPCPTSAEAALSSSLKPGLLQQADILAVINQSIPVMHGLYQQALRDNACLSGAILIEAAVDGTGAVTKVTAKVSKPELQGLADKVRAAFQQLRFPAVGKADVFHHTLNFHSQQ
ncbi:MAG: hypothetical protein K0S16_2067 [Moraxellaceae bacterium]|jgi:hypothetical protein|nr:hypothetical protein [Moraxellaceae bacterium]